MLFQSLTQQSKTILSSFPSIPSNGMPDNPQQTITIHAEPESPSSPLIPNLGEVITTDDVDTKGKFAKYVNWCRVAHYLQIHANGWLFHVVPAPDGGHVWKAPDGTAYVVGCFSSPEGVRTPDFPQAVMDHRNDPVAFESVTARDFTDTHRRCLCTCAASVFGIAWQLWAKEDVENPHREVKSTAENKTPPEIVPELPAEEQKLSDEQRQECIKLIAELPEAKQKTVVAAFRKAFDLGPREKIAVKIQAIKHMQWIKNNLPK